MKKCNKVALCKFHENRCLHIKAHSADVIECYPARETSAGLQLHCMHYPDQVCMEVLPRNEKQAGRATKLGLPCKSEAKDIARYEGGIK